MVQGQGQVQIRGMFRAWFQVELSCELEMEMEMELRDRVPRLVLAMSLWWGLSLEGMLFDRRGFARFGD